MSVPTKRILLLGNPLHWAVAILGSNWGTRTSQIHCFSGAIRCCLKRSCNRSCNPLTIDIPAFRACAMMGYQSVGIFPPDGAIPKINTSAPRAAAACKSFTTGVVDGISSRAFTVVPL